MGNTMRDNRWRKQAWEGLKALLAVFLVGISSNLISSIIYSWMTDDPLPAHWFAWLVLNVILSLFGIVLGKKVVTNLLAIETRPRYRQDADQKEVLIWLLSPSAERSFEQGASLENVLESLAEAKRLEYVKNQSLPKDQQTRTALWSWEPPLRGIHHNCRTQNGVNGALRRLVVIASTESVRQVKAFGKLVETLLAARSDIEICVWLNYEHGLLKATKELTDLTSSEAGWDFEDFDDLYNGLNRLLDTLNKQGFSDDKVAFDITGGQKPATMAAAAVTINRSATIQYVRTNPQSRSADKWTYDVLEYDLRAQASWGQSEDS